MTDKVLRVDYDIVSRWADEVAALTAAVTALGFDVESIGEGYSVTTRARRQVGIFTVDEAGAFRWGWAEKPSGSGRTDFESFDFRKWLRALSALRPAPSTNTRKA